MTNQSRQRFRTGRTGVGAPLGELETAVMREVWAGAKEGCFAADLQLTLNRDRPIALTTLLTTLDRLYDKNILRRERESRAYRYWATMTEQELEHSIVEGVLNSLIAKFPKAVATYFSEYKAENPRLSDLARHIVGTLD